MVASAKRAAAAESEVSSVDVLPMTLTGLMGSLDDMACFCFSFCLSADADGGWRRDWKPPGCACGSMLAPQHACKPAHSQFKPFSLPCRLSTPTIATLPIG